MATGGSVTTSVISSDLVTTETPLNKISTLIAVSHTVCHNTGVYIHVSIATPATVE